MVPPKSTDLARIPLARPILGDAEVAAAERVLRSGRLTGGAEVERFEASLADATQRRHVIAVSSGTTAIELALRALGIEAGDEVLVTAFGFPSAANALLKMGAKSVAVDVDEDTWLTDLDAARTLAEGRRLLVAIDQLGLSTDAASLRKFTEDTGLAVLTDAACSLGGHDAGGVAGGASGAVSTLSFHPRKPITTGEGGAIGCDDDAMADRLRALRNHGQRAPGVFSEASTNARLSAIACAIGSAQMQRLAAHVAERVLLARGYGERLASLVARGRLALQKVPAGAQSVYQSYAVQLAPDLDRSKVIAALDEAGIEAGPATYAFSESDLHENAGPAPNARALHVRALSLPMYSGLRSTELDRIGQALEAILS